jgi:hypothetical protein
MQDQERRPAPCMGACATTPNKLSQADQSTPNRRPQAQRDAAAAAISKGVSGPLRSPPTEPLLHLRSGSLLPQRQRAAGSSTDRRCSDRYILRSSSSLQASGRQLRALGSQASPSSVFGAGA